MAALVGTGGVLVHSPDAPRILARALAAPAHPGSLRPVRPRLYLDAGYLPHAVGLLAEVDAAAAVARRHVTPIEGDARHAGPDRATA